MFTVEVSIPTMVVWGWHRNISRRAKTLNMPVFLRILLVYKKTTLLPMQVQAVSEGRKSYAEKLIFTTQLLKQCATIYGTC
ncbi:hypothetical protein ACJMK2_009442 [Sinanodonta woodiana]|uniref:Uncharacterized protein n=1 Tax=Sinanodonta woodiana TaxID=1069815 RepID=A0ABD3VF78_SINWO